MTPRAYDPRYTRCSDAEMAVWFCEHFILPDTGQPMDWLQWIGRYDVGKTGHWRPVSENKGSPLIVWGRVGPNCWGRHDHMGYLLPPHTIKAYLRALVSSLSL